MARFAARMPLLASDEWENNAFDQGRGTNMKSKRQHPKRRSHGWRPRQPLALIGLRALFKLTGVLAPPVAARLAHYLWFRPQRYRMPARERALLTQARVDKLRHAGKQIVVYSWGNSGPTVLLVHGWSGRGAQLAEFVAPLIAAGFRVVTFDAPAHGRSSGHETSIVEVSAVILKLAHDFAPIHGVIAHSFGLPCVMYTLRQQRFAQSVVGIGAPATLDGLMDKFAHQLALSRRTVTILRDLLERRFGRDVWTSFSAQSIAADIDVPALIIHDHDDRDVSWHEGEAIANAWPHARFLRTEGLGHRRILRDPEVIGRIVKFLDTASSSGHDRKSLHGPTGAD
jgi:pimeloyl-ACP methyl ester carboxylesterase